MRNRILVIAAAAAVFAVGLAASGALSMPAAAPPGATALCKDGTYSFSQTHSGTCSHHGGVAVWLDGSGSTPAAPPPTTTTTPAPSTTTTTATASNGSTVTPVAPTTSPNSGSGASDLGRSVLLHAKTRSTGCRLGAEPDRRCSPGAYYSGLTKPVICASSFHTSSIRNVPDSEKHQVEVEYALAPKPYGSTLEIDHIVSLELGGSNDIANLFPEKANAHPGYRAKDKLENKLHDLVCAGKIGIRAAQQQIAADWEALYKQVFGTAPVG